MNHLNLEEFERKIAYTFSDKNLLILALTHSSYANETKKGSHENNERLEFLGDAVLDMVVSEYMYRHFPKMPEGEQSCARRWSAKAPWRSFPESLVWDAACCLARGKKAPAAEAEIPFWRMPLRRLSGPSAWMAAWKP